MRTIECTTVYGKTRNVTRHRIRNKRNMVKTCWIRRWYFLYISVFTTLPNFCKTCHVKFSVLQTFGPNTNFKQHTNALYPIIHGETSFLTRYFHQSNTSAILILAFVSKSKSATFVPQLFSVISNSKPQI
ncbi:hypothetical protein HanHA89_Chr09g0337621 [Helianthus annuus]|nr:hypothetical protein HanHA89_Chr09g0337621 [Helianthus annuus]